MSANDHLHHKMSIGDYIRDVEATLTDLVRDNIVERIWKKDHTVWKPEPIEITNRLGWLDVADLMLEQIPALQSFAREVIADEFQSVVLLGMGGSSLGAEVLNKTFGNATGYPRLLVLDSTVPASVQLVTDSIDPARTLFLVSSKSGTTTEPLTLFHYFKDIVETSIGKEKVGQSFVAITDPGTPLVKLAESERFRRIFLNPTDIGGRYSVLSYFGLVPAVLIGIDILKLLERSECMKEACFSCVPVPDNPGAWLGACIGTLARKGRDKLTLITSPDIASFGLWVEQLIAESTGKEGKGIIPVVGEPLIDPGHYGDDRLFVCLRLRDDNNAEIDAVVKGIISSGQPVLTLEMRDKYDLGTEFYRWEFATPVASEVLGVNPFDQPDVHQSKVATEYILNQYLATGHLPCLESAGSVVKLLARARKGDYLAIMAYLCQTSDTDQALAELRRRVLERYGIATTLGYGPRLLHSTGQMHKHGPVTGLFLQITADPEKDVPIPGMPYTFGVVAAAQALGDFEALKSSGRQVARINLSRGASEDILKLISTIL